jgi:hypothetical protein
MSCLELPVSPNEFEMGSQETLPLTFDATPILLSGEVVGWALAKLTQIDNGQDYSSVGLIGPVAIAGNTLTATVTSLVPRKSYRLVIQFQVAANKVWAPYLTIDCPE